VTCVAVWLLPKIFYFGPHVGHYFKKNRLILVTNIAELVKYVLLPRNDEVIKPRALNTFLEFTRLDYQPLFGKGARAPPSNPRLDA